METSATVFLVSLVGFGLYSSTLWADFVYDDSRAILSNHDLRTETPWSQLLVDDYWGVPLQHSGSHKSYRPLTVATFRLNYFLSELKPFGYHLVNVLLHCLVTVQVWFLARKFLRTSSSLLCSLLFAVHPIHTEAVAGVVGRADILATVLFLSALAAYHNHTEARNSGNFKVGISWLIAAIGCSFVSMLSKEQGITVLGVCVTYDLILHSRLSLCDLLRMRNFTKDEFRSSRRSILALLASGFTFLLFRFWIMGFQPPHFSPSDNPAAHSHSFFTRIATFAYLAAFNAKLLVIPEQLSFDWSMDAIPLITSAFDARNFLTLTVLATLLYLGRKLLPMVSGDSASISEPILSAVPLCKSAKRRSPSPKFDINDNRIDAGSSGNYSNQLTLNNNNYVPVNRNGLCSNAQCVSSCAVANSYRSKFKGANLNFKSPKIRLNSRSPRTDAAFLGLIISILTFLPASNLLAYVGFVVAERVLYLPSVGYCILVASGWERLELYAKSTKSSRLVRLLRLGTVIMLLAFAGKTWTRNKDWMNEETLYSSGVATNPAKGYSNLGNVFSQQKRYGEAEEAYKHALSHRPNMADTHYNLGTLLQETGRLEQAVVAYEKAIECRSSLAVAHLNLGLALWGLGQTKKAKIRLTTCSELSSDGLKDPKAHEHAKISCLYNLGRILAEEGQYSEAVIVYETAVSKLDPHYPSVHSLLNMLGEAYGRLGELEKAEDSFKRSLAAKPDHIPAHLTYGHLLLRKGLKVEAYSWFEKALALAPSDPVCWYHLGQFYQLTEDFDKALEMHKKAHEFDGRNFDVVFSMANVYRQLNKKLEAEKHYKLAVGLNAMSGKARMNYGAILHLNNKLEEAEVQYLKSLEINPNDPVTIENLGKLKRALKK